MDHYTTIASRTHEAWPVPMFLYDSRGAAKPAGCAYTEANIKAVAEYMDSGAAFFNRFIQQGEQDG
jgi:2,3-bisphosphoglycerate-independent phosphoglycerate mutase